LCELVVCLGRGRAGRGAFAATCARRDNGSLRIPVLPVCMCVRALECACVCVWTCVCGRARARVYVCVCGRGGGEEKRATGLAAGWCCVLSGVESFRLHAFLAKVQLCALVSARGVAWRVHSQASRCSSHSHVGGFLLRGAVLRCLRRSPGGRGKTQVYMWCHSNWRNTAQRTCFGFIASALGRCYFHGKKRHGVYRLQ
jgi:hypothetical protein